MRSIALALALAALAAPVQARPVQLSADAPTSGAIVLPLGSAADLAARGAALDAATRAAVERALASAEFDYKAKSTLSLRGIGPWSHILIVGTGDKPLKSADLQDIGGLAAQKTSGDESVALIATGLAPQVADAGLQLGVGAEIGSYSFDKYKSDAKKTKQKPLTIVTADATHVRSDYERQGRALVEAVAWARDIITEPSNVKYPEVFVDRAREAFRGVDGVRIEALDVPAMEKLGMGSILGVGKGSARPPRMLIVEYRGGGEGAPLVLAGKGITFDSGGISLKPGSGMWLMKGDMAGAAAVTATVLSLAKSRAPVNVVAIAALAENMPGGGATRPGDVLRAMNGKTIEVLNTDAEGRLVLADAVAYADSRFKPAAIVDVATLTGSVSGALGNEYAGLLTRHDALGQQLIAAGKATGEHLWQLPLHPSYAEDMKSDIADIKNVVEGGQPGAGFGGHFIGFFVQPTTPWAHLDIASVDWATSSSPTAPEGSAAFGVRLLDRFVRDWRPVPKAEGEGGY